MADREPQADRDGPLAILHQLAGDIVDRRDVIGVDRVAQPQAIGEKRGAQHQAVARKDAKGPAPDGDIDDDQRAHQQRDAALQGRSGGNFGHGRITPCTAPLRLGPSLPHSRWFPGSDGRTPGRVPIRVGHEASLA